LSARSAASALAEPFGQPVFRLRESARSAGEQAVHVAAFLVTYTLRLVYLKA